MVAVEDDEGPLMNPPAVVPSVPVDGVEDGRWAGVGKGTVGVPADETAGLLELIDWLAYGVDDGPDLASRFELLLLPPAWL